MIDIVHTNICSLGFPIMCKKVKDPEIKKFKNTCSRETTNGNHKKNTEKSPPPKWEKI